MLVSRGYEDIMNFVSMPSGHADMYSRSAAKVLHRAASLIVKGKDSLYYYMYGYYLLGIS